MRRLVFWTNLAICIIFAGIGFFLANNMPQNLDALSFIGFLFLLGVSFKIINSSAKFIVSKVVNAIDKIDLAAPQDCEVYDELSSLLVSIRRNNVAQKQEIRDLKKRQKQFETITQNMQEGLVILDSDDRILFCNKTSINIFKAHQFEEGDPKIEKEILSLENKHVWALCREQKFRKGIKITTSGKKQETILEMHGKTIKMIAGEIVSKNRKIGMAILLMDITEQTDREKLRREFSANVSHELKTPLSSISGYSELMSNGLVKTDDMQEFSTKIYRESQRLLRLISNIIQLSNLDENSDFNFEKIDLYEFAKLALEQIKEKAAERNITCELLGESIEINAVPPLIDTVLQNLLTNAVKYNKDGGTITLKIKAKETSVVISVRDTGIGIPISMQHRVFERFFRIENARSESQDGSTGLGLAIVKHVAQIHKGSVRLSSIFGRWTRVSVELPK